MAFTFTTNQAGASADYVKYLFDTPSKTDRINEPTLFDFSVYPWDASFVKLKRGTYITVTTTSYGTWFTGYITNEPEYQYIGKHPVTKLPVWGYKYEATSDDYILNLRPIGIVDPYINTTMGAVLKSLAAQLAPGVFTTTNIANGPNLARYQPDPTKNFSDVVKEFATAANFRWAAKSNGLTFQSQSFVPATIVIDGNDKHFTPSRLQLKPRQEPVINDALILGDIEPQNYISEYFLGDGFTARFPLISSIFGVDSTLLLDEDFSGNSIDPNKWTIFDTVNNWMQTSNGFLNFTGGNNSGAYDVHLDSARLIPLEGNLRITHGEGDFVAASDGVIAGLWTQAVNSSFTGCLYGIRATKVGATQLNPIANGTVDSSQSLAINASHRYIMRTLVSFQKIFRMGQTYSYIAADGTVGTSVPFDTGSVSVVTFNTSIVEVDPTNGTIVSTTNWTNTVAGLAAGTTFATYVPGVSNDLHYTVTGITISTPMQAKLEKQAKGTTVFTQQILGANEVDSLDGLVPAATIIDSNQGAITQSSFLGTEQYNPGNAALNYFKDTAAQSSTVPQAGDIIHLTYRRAGVALARVQNTTSIAAEAAQWGDNGIRSITRKDLAPPPRTSAEAEAAAAALVQDSGYQHYEGTYVQPSGYSFTGEPVSGTILKFQNLPAVLPSALQAEVITEVVTTIQHRVSPELFEHTITFGKTDRLAQLLSSFAKQTEVFSPTDTAFTPSAITTANAANGVYTDDIVAPVWVDHENDLSASFLTASGMGSFSAANTIDELLTNVAWNTNAAVANATVQLNYGAANAHSVTSFRLFMSAAGSTANYTVQYSDNGTVWNTVATNFIPSLAGWNTVVWPYQNIHQFWRLLLTNTPGAGPNVMQLRVWDADHIYFDAGQNPPTGGFFEVRYTDDSWGADDAKNLVFRPPTRQFNVFRSVRGKVCFIKAVDRRNRCLYSEDLTNAAWTKASATVARATGLNPDNQSSMIDAVTFSVNTGTVSQESNVAAASQNAIFSVSLKGTVGQQVTIQLRNNAGAVIAATKTVTFTGQWQRENISTTFAGGQ
jgi:hypothetical protein